MRARRLLTLALLLATACGAREYEGRGVVRDVRLDDGQVVIEHEPQALLDDLLQLL